MAQSRTAGVRTAAPWLATLIVLLACGGPETAVVRVAPGSTARDLRFNLAADTQGRPLPPLESVAVDGGPFRPRGRGSSVRSYLWYAARRGGVPDSIVMLRQVRYGIEPPGMVAAGPTAPLEPGHYWVAIRAGTYRAVRDFDVDADGRVH